MVALLGGCALRGFARQNGCPLLARSPLVPIGSSGEAATQFREIFDAIPDAVIVVGDDGVIVEANAQCASIVGYEHDELVGLSVERLVPSELRPIHVSHRGHFALHPRMRPMGGSLALRVVHREGHEVPAEILLAPLRASGDDASFTIAVIRDITERRSLETRIRQVQRLEAMGHLTSEVAHDFNNVLAIIKMYSELLARRLPDDSDAARSLAELERATESGTRLTRQLLAFSKEQAFELRPTSLSEVVEQMVSMLTRLVGDKIALTTRCAEQIANVMGDSGQIQQVLMNLVINARDAMPDGGRLTIENTNVVMVEADPNTHPEVPPGDYAMLAVSDTGHGMDAETVSRIFEPFFTTKKPGVGTGLGLSTVYGIVKQSGGYISVRSRPGEGTTFQIYLPWLVSVPVVDEETASQLTEP